MFIITTIEHNNLNLENTFYVTEDFSQAIRALNRLNCVRDPRIIRALTMTKDEWDRNLFGICSIDDSLLRQAVFGVVDDRPIIQDLIYIEGLVNGCATREEQLNYTNQYFGNNNDVNLLF